MSPVTSSGDMNGVGEKWTLNNSLQEVDSEVKFIYIVFKFLP